MGVSDNPLLASKRTFKQHGKSGIVVSDWLPHLSECVDDLAVIRSCWANGLNHVGSVCQMNTGSILAGRPSLGAWVTYGLGTENQNLPSFVVLLDNEKEPPGGSRVWGTGFMPATYPGTRFRSGDSPILPLASPQTIGKLQQRGKRLVKVPPEYTSQMCSRCGILGSRLSAWFRCHQCGLQLDADLNAARNIAHLGSALVGRPTVNRPIVASHDTKPQDLVEFSYKPLISMGGS